ncbi:putative ubiquinone/menaquinone biosynthesis methyltransferase UbiE [Burkholderia pseudomallei MSHR4378]|nr:putative ubiquinone/menaquinone biosynthesis methyltransferase UbiE [Burkholderia pseudomallei MSHR4378]
MLCGRPELALQRLLRSHALRSTGAGASALTPVPCFTVDRSWRFSAYSGPMLCDRPKLALQRLPRSHVLRSTGAGASARTPIPCFAIDRS